MSSEPAAKPGRAPPQKRQNGNWECGQCLNINYSYRQVCFRCGLAGGNWTCRSCKNFNFAFRKVCKLCRQPKNQQPTNVSFSREQAARSLVQAFGTDVNPVQSAIAFLSQMSYQYNASSIATNTLSLAQQPFYSLIHQTPTCPTCGNLKIAGQLCSICNTPDQNIQYVPVTSVVDTSLHDTDDLVSGMLAFSL
mmetsp:Transcript_17158/g.33432  ORF Transcript_17158/g.33432 Transcript_17158/m.33432 type:complete len:193 (+) Transcript_17158:31-609(+)